MTRRFEEEKNYSNFQKKNDVVFLSSLTSAERVELHWRHIAPRRGAWGSFWRWENTRLVRGLRKRQCYGIWGVIWSATNLFFESILDGTVTQFKS